jgi:hypothetical protein
VFPTDTALQQAVGELSQAGFDRSRFSLPSSNTREGAVSAEAPSTEDDTRQLRTLESSTAAAAAAMAGAAVVVATGGAALAAVAVAAGAGVVAGTGVASARNASGMLTSEAHDAQAADGDLIFTVTISAPSEKAFVEMAMRNAGAVLVDTTHLPDALG